MAEEGFHSLNTEKLEDDESQKKRLKVLRQVKKNKLVQISMSENSVLLRVILSIVLIVCLGLARWGILTSLVNTQVFLYEAGTWATELYVNTLTIDVTLTELVLFDNESTVNFTAPLDLYKTRRVQMKEQVINKLPPLLTTEAGVHSVMFRTLAAADMCKVLANTDEEGNDYVNCKLGLSGITNNPLSRFIQLYLDVTDDIVSSWKVGKTLEQRRRLLTDDRFTSLTSFACYNKLGLADAMYYHFILPIYTAIGDVAIEIPQTMLLTNILTSVVILLLIASMFRLIFQHFADAQRNYWSFVLAIPIRLIPYSTLLHRRLKVAAKYDLPFNWL